MFLRYNLPALIWAGFIFFLTMMPGKWIPPAGFFEIFHPDKLVHMAVFAVLVVLALYGFIKQQAYQNLRAHPMIIAFVSCSVYGFLLEVMQGTLLSDRYFEWYDATANTAGCGLGLFFFRSVLQKKFQELLQ